MEYLNQYKDSDDENVAPTETATAGQRESLQSPVEQFSHALDSTRAPKSVAAPNDLAAAVDDLPQPKVSFQEATDKFLLLNIHNVTKFWAPGSTTNHWFILADTADLARNLAEARQTSNPRWQSADVYIRKEKDNSTTSFAVGSWILTGKSNTACLVLQVRREQAKDKNRPSAVILPVPYIESEQTLELSSKAVGQSHVKVVGLDKARQPDSFQLPKPAPEDLEIAERFLYQFLKSESQEPSNAPTTPATQTKRRSPESPLQAVQVVQPSIATRPERAARKSPNVKQATPKTTVKRDRRRKRAAAKPKGKQLSQTEAELAGPGSEEEHTSDDSEVEEEIKEAPPKKQPKTVKGSAKKDSAVANTKPEEKKVAKSQSGQASQQTEKDEMNMPAFDASDVEDDDEDDIDLPQTPYRGFGDLTNSAQHRPRAQGAQKQSRRVLGGIENQFASPRGSYYEMQMRMIEDEELDELRHQRQFYYEQWSQKILKHIRNKKLALLQRHNSELI